MSTGMTTREILVAARKLIERPECWTRGVNARDAAGSETSDIAADAVCWCSYGAINRAGGGYYADGVNDAKRTLRTAFGSEFIAEFNDNHTHADILALFDRAIEAAK